MGVQVHAITLHNVRTIIPAITTYAATCSYKYMQILRLVIARTSTIHANIRLAIARTSTRYYLTYTTCMRTRMRAARLQERAITLQHTYSYELFYISRNQYIMSVQIQMSQIDFVRIEKRFKRRCLSVSVGVCRCWCRRRRVP